MLITKPEKVHEDSRGYIIDILAEGFDSTTLLTMNSGAVRGNHFHKETDQWLYVLSGSVIAAGQMLGGEVVKELVTEGHLIQNLAGERHAIKAMQDSVLIAFTRGPRSAGKYEEDTHRLTAALL